MNTYDHEARILDLTHSTAMSRAAAEELVAAELAAAEASRRGTELDDRADRRRTAREANRA